MTALQKDPSVKLLKFADDTTVISLIQDGDESAYRQEAEQLAVWCSLNHLELNTAQNCGDDHGLQEKPPALPPHTIINRTVATVEPAEIVLTSPAEEIQPATGAAETVLLCHHRVCPVFIYNCLVWFSYQNRHHKTTTDSQDC